MTQPPDGDGEAALMGHVDQDPRAHRATEPDEKEVLDSLYGPPDADGIYRGTPDEAAS